MIYLNAVSSDAVNIVITQNNLLDSFIQNEIYPACCLHPWDGSLCPCEENTLYFYNTSPSYFSLIYILARHTVNIWQNNLTSRPMQLFWSFQSAFIDDKSFVLLILH